MNKTEQTEALLRSKERTLIELANKLQTTPGGMKSIIKRLRKQGKNVINHKGVYLIPTATVIRQGEKPIYMKPQKTINEIEPKPMPVLVLRVTYEGPTDDLWSVIDELIDKAKEHGFVEAELLNAPPILKIQL